LFALQPHSADTTKQLSAL